MKKVNIFSLMIILMIVGAFTMQAQAQGRGKGNNKGKGHDKHTYVHDRHHHDRDPHHHHARVVRPVYAHQHRHDCVHHVVTHRHERPRYVYYSDYGVYHDVQRNVYFSYSGRNWTISASLPVAFHRVDMRRVNSVAVDYYADDFVGYLEHGRPIFAGVYVRR